MATRSLGQLTIDLVARIGGFTGPLDQASRAAKKDMASIAQSVKSASTTIAAVGTAAAAAAAGIVALTNNAAQNAKELKNQASLANASVQEFQRLAYASTSVGVEQDKLSDILKDVNDRVGDFLTTGGGEMADFFEQIAPRIGMTAEEFRNLSGPQALQKFYNGLEEANLSQAEMVFYMESMADEATALIPLLRDGGAGFAEMSAEADKLGIVLTELEIARLEEFAQQFDRLSNIFGSMSQILAAELAPYMSALGDELVEAVGGANGLREALPGAIRDSVAAIGPLLDGIQLVRVALEGMQAFASSVSQAYSLAFLTIQENATQALDFIASGINDVISGFNHLPGVDIPLVASFNQSGYMDALRDGYGQISEIAKEQRDQVVDLWNQPKPSRFIDDLLERAEAKAAEGITLPVIPTSAAGSGFESSESAKAAAKAAEELASAYQTLYDRLRPVETLQREYAEARALIMDQAPEAEQAALLRDLEESWKSTKSAAEAYGLDGKKALDTVDGAAKDLGFTFSSAFEDAVIGGNNLRDVMQGLLQDIQRIVMRQTITQPLGNAIAGSLNGFSWSGMFGGSAGGGTYGGGSPGGLYADGGYTGPGAKFDPAGIVHAGEFVVQKSVVDQPGVRGMLERLNQKGYADGGYVGSGSAAALGGGVEVNVYAPDGSNVKTEERDNGRGGKSIDVMIDEAVANNIRKSGSRTGKAMRETFGTSRTLTGR